MKQLNHFSFPAIATIAIASWLVACGDKEPKKSEPEKAPSVEITGIQQQAGGSQLVTYKADAAEGITYECKVESVSGQAASLTEGQWVACDPSGLSIRPTEGTVMISVRAKKGALVSAPATKLVSAQVAPQPSQSPQPTQLQAVINEKSNPQAAINQSGEVQITFTVTGATQSTVRFECQIGDIGGFAPCTSPLKIQRLVSGQIPSVSVRPIAADGTVGLVDTIQFEGGSMPQQNIPVQVPIGQYFQFEVPAGMHVNEMSSNANVNSVVDQYRIRTESDPYYVGNTRCMNDYDQDFMAMSPAGVPLKYCNSTAPDQIFKFFTDNRWAFNHLAVGTDPNVVDQNPFANEQIIFNLYQAGENVQSGMRRQHTKFYDLCKNATNGTLSVKPGLRLMVDFFGEPVRADFWMCTTNITVRRPNALPVTQMVQVGAFFLTSHDTARSGVYTLPDLNCPTCEWRYPELLEVVYVSSANNFNATPGHFAATAQRRIGPALSATNY
jgi:hypothetical protein